MEVPMCAKIRHPIPQKQKEGARPPPAPTNNRCKKDQQQAKKVFQHLLNAIDLPLNS